MNGVITEKDLSNSKTHIKGVLTLDDVQRRIDRKQPINIVSNRTANRYFFTDDHLYGTRVLPATWVPTVLRYPYSASLEGYDDPITSVDQIVEHICGKKQRIGTIKELIALVNSYSDSDRYIEYYGIRTEAAVIDIYTSDEPSSNYYSVYVEKTSVLFTAENISRMLPTPVHVRYDTDIVAIFQNGICIKPFQNE